jgi:hypothetical protein
LKVAYSDKTIESIDEEMDKFLDLTESTKNLKNELEAMGLTHILFRPNYQIFG